MLTPTILLGAGNMGRAVANHMVFEQRGIKLVGIFDNSPRIIGQRIRGLEILPTERIDDVCIENKVEAAILCIPREASSDMVERLIALGVRGFWNFSHFDISLHHPDVLVENVHLGDSLMTLSYKLNQKTE